MAELNSGDKELYLITNLCLADAMARKYAMHRAAAIKRAARRSRDQTTHAHVHADCRRIIKAPDSKTVDIVETLYASLLRDKVIEP